MDVDTENPDQLRIQRVAGGSVIKRQPVFSADGEILFVIWDSVVRAYSSQTGEWIRDLDGADGDIVNVQPDAANPKILFACTVTGQIVAWKVKSGVVDRRAQLADAALSGPVRAFHCVDLGDGRTAALVVWQTQPNGGLIQLGFFDLVLGTRISGDVPFQLTRSEFKVDVADALNYYAIVQDSQLHVGQLSGARPAHQSWRSAGRVRLTCVRCHPLEQLVATGDELGRIFVWRSLFAGGRGVQPLTRLYHWHHTAVTALCFSETGSQLYSGGREAVLVRWALAGGAEQRSFLPRVSGVPVHLAVGQANQKIALATDDNGIQVLNSQFKPIAVVQNFTWVAEDRTVTEKFPIGLRVSPRTGALMLNGRVGHLQFFSTHTRSLLYNLDTTGQNRLSLETAKVLYNTCITHAAVGFGWLVTAELLDDHQTAVEVRLKFWQFATSSQAWVLNTQVELPHEGGLTALELTEGALAGGVAESDDGVVCATAGKDNVVKLWTLERSDDVNKKGKFWACTGKTNYKNLPIRSLAFAADSSLLSVGCGNTLCVYQTEPLRLKCVLSCPAGLDGSVNKVTLNINAAVSAPEAAVTPRKDTKRTLLLEQRRKMLQAIKAYLAQDAGAGDAAAASGSLVRTIAGKLGQLSASRSPVAGAQLTLREQELVHRRLLAQPELNFDQKLELFARIGLRSQMPAELRQPFGAYVHRHFDGARAQRLALAARTQALPERQRYEASRKWANYTKRLAAAPTRESTRVRDLVSFEKATEPTAASPANLTRSAKKSAKRASVAPAKSAVSPAGAESADAVPVLPVKNLAHVKHVAFGAGEYAHLVIVCTERRLLIWNLLTVRLQTAIKLSVHRLAVDPSTSLVAAFTVHNELYVFLPNVPYTLYQRKNLPAIHGAAWIPRRYPKSHTLNLDWQARSQLYFLSTNQEILQLVSDADVESLSASAAYLQQGAVAPTVYTPFGAMVAKQLHNATGRPAAAAALAGGGGGGGLMSTGRDGKATVKEIIGRQTHTLEPLHLMCGNLLKSLAITSTASSTASDRLRGNGTNGNSTRNGTNGNGNAADADADNDNDDDDSSRLVTPNGDDDAADAAAQAANRKLEHRRLRLEQTEALARKQKTAAEDTYNDQLAVERQLQKLIKRTIPLDF